MARVMKLFLHFYLVFTSGITYSYLVKVSHMGAGHLCSIQWLILSFSFWVECSVLFFYLQKLIAANESDFILKFLEVKFGLNTTTSVVFFVIDLEE